MDAQYPWSSDFSSKLLTKDFEVLGGRGPNTGFESQLAQYENENSPEEAAGDIFMERPVQLTNDDSEEGQVFEERVKINWLAVVNRKVQQDRFGLWKGGMKSEELVRKAAVTISDAVDDAERAPDAVQGLGDKYLHAGAPVADVEAVARD